MPLVQSTGVVSGINTTSYGLTLNGVNPANWLILLFAGGTSVPTTPAGFTASNVPSAFFGGGVNVNAGIYQNAAPSSGTNSVTLSFGATDYSNAVLLEWSGVTALDLVPAPGNANNTSVNAASNSVASGGLSQVNEVIFVVLGQNTGGAGNNSPGLTDPPTGFTSLGSYTSGAVNNLAEFAYFINTSGTASVTANWSWTDTAPWSSQAVLASFEISAVAAAASLGYVSRTSPGIAGF